MRLGLVSDTHDNLPLARVAAAFLRDCDRIVHLGDVTGPATARLFEGATFLRGNNDAPTMGVREWRVDLAGVHVGAHHGHETWRGGEVDLLLHGHSHRRRREIVGRTVVVNPGALHRAVVKTIATVELPSLDVRFFEVTERGVAPMAAGHVP